MKSKMTLGRKIKRTIRRKIYADGRFAPDIAPKDRDGGIVARYLDKGSFPVIYTNSAAHAPLGIANHIGRDMRDERALFLVMFVWTMERPGAAHRLATAAHVYLERRPNHRIVLLCNSQAEKSLFDAEGVEAVFCNHNALSVDETVFRPLATEERVHDAVYNGAMVGWKRRHLARLVDRCAQIYYEKSDADHDETMALLDEMRRLMPGHAFLNPEVDGVIQHLDPEEVNRVLNSSRVGLCLSEVEGAMLASMEYLLAGLPVVSTPSLGGRDAFADPEFWLEVGETAEDVRDGVTEMAARNPDPERIRNVTLEKIHQHRQRLRRLVAETTGDEALLPDDLGHEVYRQPLVWKNGRELARDMLQMR